MKLSLLWDGAYTFFYLEGDRALGTICRHRPVRPQGRTVDSSVEVAQDPISLVVLRFPVADAI